MPRKNGRRVLRAFVVAVVCLCASSLTRGASPVSYRFTFPEPEHHWMQVDVRFTELDAAPLELRMSRSSPGRYSLHDFAKNVYDVRAYAPEGAELAVTRPDPYGWTVPQHGPALTVRYKVFGDRVDGTYLAIDTGHAHLNMPAAILWARGHDDRAATLTFVPPNDAQWQVATQLHPGATPFEFTAPNLQYLMDSPTEFGPVSIKTFQVNGQTFRFSAHHTGSAGDLDSFVKDVATIVREEGAIFGEYPSYDSGAYTFLADYLPYASGDAMEHRNSTVMTSPGSIRGTRLGLLDTVAHEFFHGWNVERIRPQSLEPFDFEHANISGELWLAEGFTEYYAALILSRTGLNDVQSTAQAFTTFTSAVTINPGRDARSAAEMSQMAAFIDGGRSVDRTNWANTYISYYPHGGAIALGLDLSMRERSQGRVTLDDFMRAMWRIHGKPGGARQGYVDRPYTLEDAERRLAEVTSDAQFAKEFFARYVHGREVPDFARLLQPMGMTLRKSNPGRAWWGDVRLEQRNGVRIVATPLANTPLYKAGLDIDDEIRQLDGMRVSSPDDAMGMVRRHRPGDTLAVEFVDRAGKSRTSTILLVEDPRADITPIESTGGAVNSAQRAARQGWLGSRQ